jgi:hypothetical protein
LREGEGNTKLFHLVAYGRRTNNLMTAIKHGDELITDQGRNKDLFLQTYQNLIGTIQSREATLDLETPGLRTQDLRNLREIFTEAEVWAAVKEMPADRAPGPVGFIGAFYK